MVKQGDGFFSNWFPPPPISPKEQEEREEEARKIAEKGDADRKRTAADKLRQMEDAIRAHAAACDLAKSNLEASKHSLRSWGLGKG
ncbi:hypothetical protein GCM10023205_53300 [Yinghuangia aomiensis]|uniref:Uncharacterized protein n=1 Tax=Yinghuangia aomiensis TaxID=676205 RepID=A0ABP9HUB9_9ACTN